MRRPKLRLKLGKKRSGGASWPDAPEDSDLIGEGAVVGEYDDTETEIELTPDIYDEIEPGDVLLVQSTGELMRVVSKDGDNVATVERGHGGTTPEAIPDGGKVRGYRPHFLWFEDWQAYAADANPSGDDYTQLGAAAVTAVDAGDGDIVMRVSGGGTVSAMYGIDVINIEVGQDFTIDFQQFYTSDVDSNFLLFRIAASTLGIEGGSLEQGADGSFYTVRVSNAGSVIRRCANFSIGNVDTGDGHGSGTGLKSGRIRLTWADDDVRIRVYSGTTELMDYTDLSPPSTLGGLMGFQLTKGGLTTHQIGDIAVSLGDLGAPE